jgi:hypothetical protein
MLSRVRQPVSTNEAVRPAVITTVFLFMAAGKCKALATAGPATNLWKCRGPNASSGLF